MQTFTDDAPDLIAEALPVFSLTEIVGASEFDADAGTAEAEEQQEESSDTDTDDEAPKIKRRTDQFFASASDYCGVEEDTTASLATKRDDSKNVRAFKIVLSEVIRKRSQSMTGYSAMVVYVGEHATSAPALCDWLADICLSARAALSIASYQVFVTMLETDFELWQEVPESLRLHIMQRVGRELLRRRIVNEKGNTGKYFQQPGGSLLQRVRFAKGWR